MPSREIGGFDMMSTQAAHAVPVTVENFIRAETDMYFGNCVRDGGFGKLHHNRELMPIDKQTVIRANRDTLYSTGVFDLEAGPVTAMLPDAGDRFMSLMVITEDHYVPAVRYGAGTHTLTRESVGTRYVLLGIRTLVNPQDRQDVKRVHALQDAIRIDQNAPGRFEVPEWDPTSQRKVRDALLALGSTLSDTKRMFGTRDQVDPVRRLIGAALGWGGNPDQEALYLNVTPERNDGSTAYRLSVPGDVPVDGFWSISVYNAQGYFEPNADNAYTLNNVTARKGTGGSVSIQFGGRDDGSANRLPVPPRWNYLVRLYRPRPEILNGRWTFPEAQPLG